MQPKVAIVAVAQNAGAESADNMYDQAFRVAREVLDKAGITRDELGVSISAASDIFHGGISCANAYYWDTVGAFLKNGSRQDGESLFALAYAAMRIMSGHYETALVMGLCKGSENPPHDSCTLMFADPFYQRELGLQETVAAAFQMRLYMERYGITPEQCARVAVKNLGNAMGNPYAQRKGEYSIDDILGSTMLTDPLTALQVAPQSEGMVALLLASEDKARELTDNPVWLRGYGSSIDTYVLGDRDLLGGQLTQAAGRAYAMAGIEDPRNEIDCAEICEPYAFQELMWYEDLGLCARGDGAALLQSGATMRDGDIPVNPSGGVLANNPYVSRGLQRVVEATLQIRGEAGQHQVGQEVKTALAHGTHGFAGQCHAVAILGAQ